MYNRLGNARRLLNRRIQVHVRCGFGSDFRDQDDAQFKRNADECVRLGIPFGAYLYSYAKGAAQAMSEADHAIRLCDPYRDHMAYPYFSIPRSRGLRT